VDMFRNPQSEPLFNAFFKGDGQPRVFVYYQSQYKILESGELQDVGGQKEFVVSDGEKIKLRGKGLYFLRTTPPGKAINPNGANDNEILFGEVSEHTVTSLNTIINQVYKPFIDRHDDWGACDEEHKKEFVSVFDKFANELKEALKSL